MFSPEAIQLFEGWVNDDDGWNRFTRDYLNVKLDPQQDEVLHAVRHNPKVAVASGTSRGKDFLMACAGTCFFYLTPYFDESGKMTGNTKVILTGPTDRQVKKIMMPEVSRIFKGANYLPGYLTDSGIKTMFDEWYLMGFKADDKNTEAWTGYHAANILFGVTEASGMDQSVFDAIEGNLQGNSRLVLVFNPNVNFGYAASAFKSPSFKKIQLSSLDAPNVKAKKILFPGQVDYQWIKDRLTDWCKKIKPEEKLLEEGDFDFENQTYRPNDLFRVKVLGQFPNVAEGVLIPPEWIAAANKRWKEWQEQGWKIVKPLRLGADIAGMGRDLTCFCPRYDTYVPEFKIYQGGGSAAHMEVCGKIVDILKKNTDLHMGVVAQAFIDTIGEGAGVYSRSVELSTENQAHAWLKNRTFSSKFSEAAKKPSANGEDIPLRDANDVYEFLNMRAYCYWAIRDWLDPSKESKAALPPDDFLLQELTETKWKFRSDGRIQIVEKEEIKKAIGRSPDRADALALTFWPVPNVVVEKMKRRNVGQFFH